MRIKPKYTEKDIGKTRNIVKILYFPLKINGEWRWFEKAIIQQRIAQIDIGDSLMFGYYKYDWVNDKFIN